MSANDPETVDKVEHVDKISAFKAIISSKRPSDARRKTSLIEVPYYKDLYNSKLSPSSAWVTYQPEGAGQRARTVLFDTSIIPDPENWLAKRLGPHARFEFTKCTEHVDAADGEVKASAHSGAGADESEGASNAPDKNPAVGEQATTPPHARDVPKHHPTQETLP